MSGRPKLWTASQAAEFLETGRLPTKPEVVVVSEFEPVDLWDGHARDAEQWLASRGVRPFPGGLYAPADVKSAKHRERFPGAEEGEEQKRRYWGRVRKSGPRPTPAQIIEALGGEAPRSEKSHHSPPPYAWIEHLAKRILTSDPSGERPIRQLAEYYSGFIRRRPTKEGATFKPIAAENSNGFREAFRLALLLAEKGAVDEYLTRQEIKDQLEKWRSAIPRRGRPKNQS